MKNSLNILKKLPIAVIAILMVSIPAFTDNNYIISTLVYCFVFASLAIAWNLIGGYGEQVSWCNASFVAIGAYTGMIMYKMLGISPFIAILVGMGLAFIAATLIGYGTFRLRGIYFSIATIAFGEIVRISLQFWQGLTGGAAGYYVTYTGQNFSALMFKNDVPFYYILLALLVIVILIASWFERSKIGHYLSAIKGDEDAAISLGIDSFKIKLTTFQLSAVISAAVGTFFGFFIGFIDPGTVSSLNLSVKIVVIAIIGGVGTIWGPVLGSFVINILAEGLNSMFGDVGGLSLAVYGFLLIVIVIFKPAGLISLFPKWGNNSKSARKSDDESTQNEVLP